MSEKHDGEIDQCEHCGSAASEIVDYYGNDVPACTDCGALL